MFCKVCWFECASSILPRLEYWTDWIIKSAGLSLDSEMWWIHQYKDDKTLQGIGIAFPGATSFVSLWACSHIALCQQKCHPLSKCPPLPYAGFVPLLCTPTALCSWTLLTFSCSLLVSANSFAWHTIHAHKCSFNQLIQLLVQVFCPILFPYFSWIIRRHTK